MLLLKTNMGAGHGGKSGRFTALEEAAEEYVFILTQVADEGHATVLSADDRVRLACV